MFLADHSNSRTCVQWSYCISTFVESILVLRVWRFKGVSIRHNKWQCYTSEEEAAIVYDEACIYQVSNHCICQVSHHRICQIIYYCINQLSIYCNFQVSSYRIYQVMIACAKTVFTAFTRAALPSFVYASHLTLSSCCERLTCCFCVCVITDKLSSHSNSHC